MKLLRTKYLSHLAESMHKLMLALMLVMPLITASAVTKAEQAGDFSQAQLDQMLAPIALYPDALLSQVLIASTYPLEIIQADRWVRSNKDLNTEDALKFAENKDWDPSVKALVAFPDILKRMSDDVDWTQSLGDAFLNNEGAVMDAVQRLRKRAYATGNLEKAQHISVARDDDNIIIEPAQERVVYVPVYDTRVVYGNWWWPEYPPVYWRYPSHYTYVSGFYWGSSIYLHSSYFYSSCRWNDRRVVVIDRHNHYDSGPRFYTGRTIVSSNHARNWTHNPVHRQGVAYYNNRLRENYGSPRQSYQHDRQYREQHRDASRDNRYDNRYDNHHNQGANHNGNNRPQDRSNEVRERLSRTSNGSPVNFNGTGNNGGWVNTGRTEQNAANRDGRNQHNGTSNREQNRPNPSTTTTNFALPTPEVRNNNATRNEAPTNDVRNDDAMNRQRAALQEERTQATSRLSQERRFTNDRSERRAESPEISVRTEQPAPQQRPERREAAPRAAEPNPQRAEGLAEQRAERMTNSRFSRDRQDNER